MSFVYEGLRKATRTYDPNGGAKFYQYAVQATRGILQNYYNYNNDLIHIPVMRRKKVNKKTNRETGIKHELCEVNDYSESQYQYISSEMEDENNDLSNELTMILTEYENQPTTSYEIKKDIEIFKMAREYTLKDISLKTGINTVRLRKIIDDITTRLIKFYKKLKRELY